MRHAILATLTIAAACLPAATALAADAGAILDAAGSAGGLVAVLGCDDPALLAGLRPSDAYLVHGLDTDPAAVAAARKHLRAEGVYGRVTAGHLAGGRLPFVDDLVNVLVVADADAAVPEAEMQRCLAPGGVLVDARRADLQVTRAPVPADIDAWTHYLYDASNNAVSNDTAVAPPRGLRWTCGPRYARSHEHLGSVSAMVSAGGRVFYIQDAGPISSVFLPPEWELVARDAFSGVRLWRRPVEQWESQLRGFRSGPPEIGRRMVFGGGRLWVALNYADPVIAVDPVTGKTLATLDGSEGARELLYAGDTLYVLADDMTADDHEARKRWFNTRAPDLRGYQFPKEPLSMYGTQRVTAYDAASGKQRWCDRDDRPAAEIMPATMAVDDGRLCFQTTDEVVCLDAASGKERWRAERPVAVSRYSWASPTLVVDDGVVVTGDRMPDDNIGDPPEAGSAWIMDNRHQMDPQPGELIAFALDDGKELWRAPAFENYTIPMDIFVVGGLVWAGHVRSRNHPGFTKGRDLKTGEVKVDVPHNKELYNLRMGHNRCYRNKATRRFLILGRDGIEFVDPAKGTGSGHWWVRGTCQYGVMPANGLVYAPVHSCACHVEEKLSGFNTLAPVSAAPETEADAADRLVKGPAYGATVGAEASDAADWPTYRRDTRRSGYQALGAPKGPKAAWTAECTAPLTAPVFAGDTVYVAETDRHTVRAFDADDGTDKWTFVADGRIDSPPTVCGNLVLFGTRGGSVYCLRAGDGELLWRFRAAPAGRRLFAYGQLESAWPVHGAVLVDREASGGKATVYCAAGRSSHLDGGIRLWALDAETGEPRHTAAITADETADETAGGKNAVKAATLPDILSMQDGNVYMRHMRFLPRLSRQNKGLPHLYAPGGFLDDTWWHRTYWIYGTRMMSGYGGWPRIGNVTPSGRLLVYDGGEMIYGYGRMTYRAGAGHVRPDAAKDYKVFAEVRSPKPRPEDKKKRGPAGRREITWAEPLPFVARALVLSRDALLVAGGDGLPGTDADREAGTFCIVSRADGGRRAACRLPAPPVLDGMALTARGIFVSTMDGKVVCLRDASSAE